MNGACMLCAEITATFVTVGEDAHWCHDDCWDRIAEQVRSGDEAMAKMRSAHPTRCQKCGREFRTPQGLGLHFHHGCESIITP